MQVFFTKFYKHIILFTIITLLGNYAVSYFYTLQEEQYLHMQTKLLKTKYDINYKYLKIVSSDIYDMYKKNRNIIKILEQVKDANTTKQNELRSSLYKLLKKRYKRLKNMGIEQFHFHLPDNTSFLRMHKPDKFGDNLSGIRQSVELTNKNKTVTEGFEVGRVIHGFRFVYPLFNSNKEHLGSLEVSFSSKQLLEIMADEDSIHLHFLVSKEAVDEKAWYKEIYERAWESQKFLLEKDTESTIEEEKLHNGIKTLELVPKISEKIGTKEPFSIATIYNNKSLVLGFMPIKNIDNNKVLAYLIIYKYSEHLDSVLVQKHYFSIIVYSIILLVFMFGFYVINSREKFREMAHYDELTKLPNRSYFYIEFQRELKRAARYKTKLALLFIDLDGFKEVNDNYGHGAGDELLKEVSQRIKKSIRDIDIVARLGGDEFVALLPDIAHSSESLIVAKKIIYTLNKELIIKKKTIFIGASIGISIYPEHGESIDELMKNADNMMYNVKNSGKNSAQIY